MAFAPPITQAKTVRQNRRWIAGILMASLFLSGGVIGAGLAAIAIHSQREKMLLKHTCCRRPSHGIQLTSGLEQGGDAQKGPNVSCSFLHRSPV